MLVYRVTNTVNGKVYIGKFMGGAVARRWKEHQRLARNGSRLYFHNAIRSYGADAFAVEVLYRAKTKEELPKMETFFIVMHQSHKHENGYNLTMGGDGTLNPSEELRERFRRPRNGDTPISAGKKFGKLTVLSRAESGKYGASRWTVRCECGVQKTASERNLRGGQIVGCGKCGKTPDLLGRKFGRLTVMAYKGSDAARNSLWSCQCQCGSENIVRGSHLRSGNTKSCGCLHHDSAQGVIANAASA